MCGWPGCSQRPWEGSLCYYHGKLAAGLLDGRDSIPVSRTATSQDRLTRALSLVGAPQEVIERAAEPKKHSRSTRGGAAIPRGILHVQV